MAEMIERSRSNIAGEAVKFAGKAVGNIILAGYALHLGREWGGPALDRVAQKIERWRQNSVESETGQQIEQ